MKNILYTAITKISPDDINVPRVDEDTALQNILNTAYTWAGVVCVIILVIAGIMYVLSAGESSKVKKAKDAIMGAVIGLIFILLAYTITAFVMGRIG
jgi:uncharacterized BrkB/YihY/UPF0761 family membrane protein